MDGSGSAKRDLIGQPTYNYVGNNPINSIDPNGMSISGVNQPSGSMPEGFSFRDSEIDYYYGTSAQQAFRSWQSEYDSYEESGKTTLSKYTTNAFNSSPTDDGKCGCDGKPPCPEVLIMESVIPIGGLTKWQKMIFKMEDMDGLCLIQVWQYLTYFLLNLLLLEAVK